MQYGFCHLAAIPLRREPNDRSEMTNQILFGESMSILEESEKWYMIRLSHDNYEGWVDKKQIRVSDKFPVAHNHVVSSIFTKAINDRGSHIILPAGSMLQLDHGNINIEGESFSVEDGSFQKTNLLAAAQGFLRTPYLWGGRTFMGIDCSGFTQIIMRLQGTDIPRDAFQQALIGDPISFIDESVTGDLAFFDNAEGRITHVGIIFNNNQGHRTIIHASGCVRSDKLDHQGIFNEEAGIYSHNLRIIKRITTN